jgi:hypothetical protein
MRSPKKMCRKNTRTSFLPTFVNDLTLDFVYLIFKAEGRAILNLKYGKIFPQTEYINKYRQKSTHLLLNLRLGIRLLLDSGSMVGLLLLLNSRSSVTRLGYASLRWRGNLKM